MLNESLSTDPLAFQVLSYDNPKIHYIFLVSIFSLPLLKFDQKNLLKMLSSRFHVFEI